MYLHCIRSLRFVFFFERDLLMFFNKQVLFTSVPVYFHCIHSLHILKDVSDLLDSSQLYALASVIHIVFLKIIENCLQSKILNLSGEYYS